MAVNPPATWLLSQPCPCQTDTWSMAYLPAQRRPLTTHLSGRSLISRLNPFLDLKPLSPVTGIFHKKLSLGRIKLKTSLFPLKRKKKQQNSKNCLENLTSQDQVRGKNTVQLQKVNKSLNSWGAVPPTPFQTPQFEGPQPLHGAGGLLKPTDLHRGTLLCTSQTAGSGKEGPPHSI